MMVEKPRNFTHIHGDSSSNIIEYSMGSNKTGYSQNFEVRCIIELDDDETFCNKKPRRPSPTRTECPAMKERLARHIKNCPSHSNKSSRKCSSSFGAKCSTDCQTMQLNIKPSKKVMDKEILTDFYEKSLALSPVISMDDKLYNTYNQQSNSKSPSVIEKPIKTDHYATGNIEELFLRKKDPVQDQIENRNNNKVRQTETVILHPRGQYKDNLQTVIRQWLLEIPVFPYIDEAAKITRENAVNELNETIFNLSVDINNDQYEDNVKSYIDHFIKDLPIWYPCSMRDQRGYKKDLENNLLHRIKTLNKELFNASNDKKTYVKNCDRRATRKEDSATEIDSKIEKAVINYLSNLAYVETDDWGHLINIHRVKYEVIQLLRPVIKIMSQLGKNKLYLKKELMNILRDLPLAWLHNKEKQLDKYADELSDIILTVRPRKPYQRNSSNSHVQNCDANSFNFHQSDDDDVNKYKLTQDIIQLINSVIDTKNSSQKRDLVDMLLNSFESIRAGNESYAKDEIYKFLMSSFDISEQNASFLTKTIVKKIKNAQIGAIDKSSSPIFLPRERQSKSVLVFISDHDLSGPGPSSFPIASTPKKTSLKKEVPKLNTEEMKYLEELSKLINAWIDTVPELVHVNEDSNYKQVMVSDLAGHLMDEMKLEQYGPDKNYLGTRDNLIKCTVLSWIIKFEEEAFQNMAEDQKTTEKYLDIFYDQFSKIPVPMLTKPHHGTRQDQKASKFRRNESNRSIECIPEGIDILEDEISIWMNEQPSHIYANQSNNARNEMLHDFALKLQDQLKNKKSGEEIKLAATQWLDRILKPNEKNNIDNLAEILKERITKVPLDETLRARREEKIRLKNEIVNENESMAHGNKNIEKYNLNKTLLEFIDKFIEHNYEEDDILVKGALIELLKSEFRRLSRSEKSDMYQTCGPACESKEMLPDRLNRELHYIKEISDWLKNMPVEKSFNVPGNQERVEFVISLAKDICDLETERIQAPKAMSYDDYLLDLIPNHFNYLPFLPNKKPTYQNLLELYARIVNSRNKLNKNESLNNSETKGQTWGEFVDEYIRVNAKEIADDPVKLEVYHARILQEIFRMLQSSDPILSFKEKLANVPKPGDDTVIEFNRKLMYAHEIGDWIKNMPLQTISDEETTDMITKMISDLADELSRKHTNNIKDDSELMEFVMNWILTLPLEPSKEIDVSVLIQQLSNRIKRINEGKYQNLNDSSILQHNESIPKTKQHDSFTGRSKIGCSGELIVDAIEEWCNKLPIKEQDENSEKRIKDNIAIRLFQTVGDLNLDPRFNDDNLYQDLLGDEIDNIFKDLNKYEEVQRHKETLKSTFLSAIVEARSIIKEQTAGEEYKQKLENTIEASIPAPVTHKKIYDPGFEIYKNKLTNMFILENFDHGDDPVKLKYEVKIKDAIDKYFQEAQKRTAIPLSRDEIYNDLYSALFKVPIPNESSIIQEVEEVKLRCEIDGWFEGLPIREPMNLNEQLDWDKILAMLAKRIYEIESNDPQAEEKIHKEITKWLIKFPLLPGEERNVEKQAKALEDRLKTSRNDRKCVPRSQMDIEAKKGKSLKKLSEIGHKSLDRSQTAGPSGVTLMPSSPMPCCVAASTPKRKPGDLLLEIVENWCLSLPLSQTEEGNDRTIRDNLVTNILRKLSELNTDPRVFDDDILYDEYLKDELELLIRTLPMCCELQRSKDVRKQELIAAIRSIKPLIRNDRAKNYYKKEIKNTIKEMLPGPLDTTVEKAVLFKDLVDEIADSFVQYNYNRDDYEGKQVYKNQIREAIIKYFSEINNQSYEDPLLKQNKLICELIKVPIPSEAVIKEHVEEIKMKDEVSNFLDEVISDDSKAVAIQKEHIKSNLSKRLHDLEKNGHSCANDRTMKEEIVKSLKKANQDVDVKKVEEFVSQLKENEAIRKSPPIRKPDVFQTSVNVNEELKQHGWTSYYDQPPKDALHQYQYQSESEKFYTLLPDNHPYPGSPQQFSANPQAEQILPDKSYNYQSSGQNLHLARSPSPIIHYSPEGKEPFYSYHTLPEIPGMRPPSEMLVPRSMTYNSGESSDRSAEPGSMIYNSGQSSDRTSPRITFDSRFLPRPQTRRQSLDVRSGQSTRPRRQSLQTPLKYDYNLHDNKTTANYRDVCVEPPEQTSTHMPLPVLAFNDKTPIRVRFPFKLRPASPTQNRSTVTSPRPMSPLQRLPTAQQNKFSSPMQGQPISTPGVSIYRHSFPPQVQSRSQANTSLPRPLTPSQIPPTAPVNVSFPRPTSTAQNQPYSQETPQLVSLFEPSPSVPSVQQTPINTITAQQNLTVSHPMTTQSYQGFQNAVAAVSSPVPIEPQATTPISLPTAEVGSSQDSDDVRREGAHRMASTPRTLRNPPRKRRRVRADGEEEEICECLGRDIRCTPFPEFPFWCYMPYRFPGFCLF